LFIYIFVSNNSISAKRGRSKEITVLEGKVTMLQERINELQRENHELQTSNAKLLAAIKGTQEERYVSRSAV